MKLKFSILGLGGFLALGVSSSYGTTIMTLPGLETLFESSASPGAAVTSGSQIDSGTFGTSGSYTVNYFHSGTGTASPFNFSNGSSDVGVSLATRALGDWMFVCVDVDFGAETGTTVVNGHDAVSAADFSTTVSSMNGSSNYYESGFMALKTVDTSGSIVSLAPGVNPLAIQNYLSDVNNYNTNGTDVEIGTALGANVANDSFNMFADTGNAADQTFATTSSTGNNGTENSNDTWNNTDFGLTPTTAITGFTTYYALGISNTESQRSGPGASWGNIVFPDTPTVSPVAVKAIPEPSRVALLILSGAMLLLRRNRRA